MTNEKNHFGETLKQARMECSMTQEELAARVDVTTRYISALENEGKEPSFTVLNKIVHVLHISADVFFYPEKAPAFSEKARLEHMMKSCSDREIRILLKTAQALLDNP